MNDPIFLYLEGDREVEYCATMLYRRDPARRETTAVTQTIYEIHDRGIHVTRENEVAVEGVRLSRFIHRLPSRNDGLREDLSPEHPLRPDIAIRPAVDVDLDRFEIEEIDQSVE